MTSKYLKYTTNTKVTIRFQEKIRIPVVISCTNTVYEGGNVSEFFSHFLEPEVNPVTKYSFMEERLTHPSYLTVHAPHDLLNKLIQVKTFSRGRQKCHAFRPHVQEMDRKLFSLMIEERIFAVTVHRRQNMCHNSQMYLISRQKWNKPIIRTISEYSVVCVYTTEGNETIIRLRCPFFKWQRTEIRLMKPPYDTKCTDYQTSGRLALIVSMTVSGIEQFVSRKSFQTTFTSFIQKKRKTLHLLQNSRC